jgi:hypothetical protein
MMNKTTPEYQKHSERLMYVSYFLTHNPNYFAKEELDELKRYRGMKSNSWFYLGLYLVCLIGGRAKGASLSSSAKYGRITFQSSRQ